MGTRKKPSIESAAQALYDVHQVLTTLGVEFVPDGGTLLGFHRDGTFCKDDQDDIDLTVKASYWDRNEEIHAAMLAKGFKLYHRWGRRPEKHRSGQYAWRRALVKIDLMFKELHPRGDRYYWTVYGPPGKRRITYKAVPNESYDVITEFPVSLTLPEGQKQDITLYRPQDIDSYLTYRYGNWQKPLHRSKYSCYSSDLAILKPNKYEMI